MTKRELHPSQGCSSGSLICVIALLLSWPGLSAPDHSQCLPLPPLDIRGYSDTCMGFGAYNCPQDECVVVSMNGIDPTACICQDCQDDNACTCSGTAATYSAQYGICNHDEGGQNPCYCLYSGGWGPLPVAICTCP
jgi:hypothetical protein